MTPHYDDEFDALAQMVAKSDKGMKELAVFLFPHMKLESAHARLRACFNPEKDERLTFGQIISAMRFCGQFDPLHYACDETLHARPDRKTTEDQVARIADTIDTATAMMNTALKQLAQLQGAQQGGPTVTQLRSA